MCLFLNIHTTITFMCINRHHMHNCQCQINIHLLSNVVYYFLNNYVRSGGNYLDDSKKRGGNK